MSLNVLKLRYFLIFQGKPFEYLLKLFEACQCFHLLEFSLYGCPGDACLVDGSSPGRIS